MVGVETADGLYEAVLRVVTGKDAHITSCAQKGRNLWHHRLAHCGDDILVDSISHVEGIKKREFRRTDYCHTCAIGK